MFGYKIKNEITNREFFFEKPTIAEREIFLNEQISKNSYGLSDRWIEDSVLPSNLLGRKKHDDNGPVSRIIDNTTEWLIKSDYIVEELNVDRAFEQNVNSKIAKCDFGKYLIALILQLNEENEITIEQSQNIFSSNNINALIVMLQTGSLETARAIISSIDLTNLAPFNEEYRSLLISKINEYLGD